MKQTAWIIDMTEYAGSRDYVGNRSLREEPHTDPHIPLKKMIPTRLWQTPTLSLPVPCTKHPHRTRNERVGVCHDRVGIIFFNRMWGSVWGSSGSLRNPETRRTPSYDFSTSNSRSTIDRVVRFVRDIYYSKLCAGSWTQNCPS